MKRLQPGDTLGTCIIESHIAEGGMATVYKANQTLMKRTVAIKVLKPKMLRSEGVLGAFLKEGMAGARLTHPSIAQVYYTAEENGVYYIVMDFVDGSDLRTYQSERGRLSTSKVLEISRQVASILCFTHDRGIIHRDIKPGNIMLTKAGDVMLTDFGIASLLGDAQADDEEKIVGTPAYMSPEQFYAAVDERSDLYSLGATMYTLLTGSPPFRGADLVQQVLNDRPRPLRKVNPNVPKRVAALVDRLLTKSPDERYQTARDVVTIIDEMMSDQGQKSTKTLAKITLGKSRVWWPWIAGGVASLVFVTSMILASMLSPSEMFAIEERQTIAHNVPAPLTPVVSTPAAPDPEARKRLEESLVRFVKAVEQRNLQPILSVSDAEYKSDARFLNSLLNLLEARQKLPIASASEFAIIRQDAASAHARVVFLGGEGEPNLNIHTSWKLGQRGQWMLYPDPPSGRMRFHVKS